MPDLIAQSAEVFRDYVVTGLSASGANDPLKPDIRALLTSMILASQAVAAAGGATVFATTQAGLFADLAHPNQTIALVYQDATPDSNDFYLKSGSSGSGSWAALGLTIPASMAAQIAYAAAGYQAIDSQLVLMQSYLAQTIAYNLLTQNSATASAASATASAASATSSATSATAAAGSQAAAATSAFDAIAAVTAAGASKFYDTYAAASADLAGIADQQVISVFADEGQSGSWTFYRKQSGTLSLKLSINSRIDNSITSGITNRAPSQNAVYLALAAKVDLALANATFLQAGTGAASRSALSRMREQVFARDFATNGDGVTDDTALIQAAVNAAVASSGRLSFHGADIHLIRRNPSGQQSTGLSITSGIILDGYGTTLRGGEDNSLIYGKSTNTPVLVTADIAAGATVIPVADGTQFAAGNDVIWRLGDVPYDTPETQNFGWAKVVSVSVNNVTIDRPVMTAFTLSGAVNNKHLVKLSPITGFRIRDFNFDAKAGSTVESAINLTYARDGTIERIRGTNTGAGIIVVQYCQDLSLDDISGYTSPQSQTSFGNGISIAESTGIKIGCLSLRGFINHAVNLEDGARATVLNLHDINTFQYSGSNRRTILNAVGKSDLTVYNLDVEGYGGFVTCATNNGSAGYSGRITIHNARFTLDTDAYGVPVPCRDLTGRLTYSVAGIVEQYDAADAAWWDRVYFLKDGEALTTFGPAGILCDLRIYASQSMSLPTDITSLYIGRQTDNGVRDDASLVAGSEVAIPTFAGTVAGTQWTLRANRFQVLINAASSGLTGTGKFIRIRAQMVQNQLSLTTAMADANVLGPYGQNIISGEGAYTFSALAAGASVSTTVTVTGAVVGDYVDSVAFTTTLGGIVVDEAEITANDTATITFRNPTGGSVTPSAGTLRVQVAKPRLGA